MSSKPKAEAKVAILKGQEGIKYSITHSQARLLRGHPPAEDRVLEYVKRVPYHKNHVLSRGNTTYPPADEPPLWRSRRRRQPERRRPKDRDAEDPRRARRKG